MSHTWSTRTDDGVIWGTVMVTGGGASRLVGDPAALLGGESMSTVSTVSASPTRRGLERDLAADAGRPAVEGLVTREKDARLGDAISPRTLRYQPPTEGKTQRWPRFGLFRRFLSRKLI